MEAVAVNSADLHDDVEKYIRERIALEVDSAVHSAVALEEDRRFRQLRWLIALVGLVGLGTFGTLSNYLIEKAVDGRLEARTGNISDSLEFIRFNSVVLKLDLGTSFTTEDRKAIMSYLRRVATNERVRHTEEFNAALVQVMKSFTQAGLASSIDEIFQLYERELLATDTLVEILLHHYGQEVTSRHTVPADDFAMRVFDRLEALAAGAKVPELALAYRSLYLHRQNSGAVNEAVTSAITRAAMLSEVDLARYYQEILVRTRAKNWQSSPDSSGIALQGLTRSFISTYASEIERQARIERGILSDVAKEGVSEESAEALAEMLAIGTKKSKPNA